VQQKGLNYYIHGYIHDKRTKETMNAWLIARCWRSVLYVLMEITIIHTHKCWSRA